MVCLLIYLKGRMTEIFDLLVYYQNAYTLGAQNAPASPMWASASLCCLPARRWASASLCCPVARQWASAPLSALLHVGGHQHPSAALLHVSGQWNSESALLTLSRGFTPL